MSPAPMRAPEGSLTPWAFSVATPPVPAPLSRGETPTHAGTDAGRKTRPKTAEDRPCAAPAASITSPRGAFTETKVSARIYMYIQLYSDPDEAARVAPTCMLDSCWEIPLASAGLPSRPDVA